MITISHNEIIVACLKAFESLGLPQGQREDAAESIGWLALHGLPFEDHLTSAVHHFSAGGSVANMLSQAAEGSVWDAQGVSALHIFPMLVDYATTQTASDGRHTLTIVNLPDLELMWPYVLQPMKRGYKIDMRWMPLETVGRMVLSDGAGYPNMYWVTSVGESLVGGEVRLVIEQADHDPNEVADIDGEIIRIENVSSLTQTYLNQTKTGILIEDGLWQNLKELGTGILVEATAESEQRGAGGV